MKEVSNAITVSFNFYLSGDKCFVLEPNFREHRLENPAKSGGGGGAGDAGL
jgi:hypothetical protein